MIDIIDDSTMAFIAADADDIQVGGFDWNLQFNWHALPDRENANRRLKTDPVRLVLLNYMFSTNPIKF